MLETFRNKLKKAQIKKVLRSAAVATLAKARLMTRGLRTRVTLGAVHKRRRNFLGYF